MNLKTSPFATPAAPIFPLSFSDITKTEGVYAIEGRENVRLVVLRSYADKLAVLFVSCEGVQPANDSWNERKYTKTNEEFQVFIK